MSTHFDALIIGAGQAGPYLADRFSAAGQKIAIVERKFFGGTCVNTGCVIQRAVHIHPTVSEVIPTMLGELQPLSASA